MKNGVRFFLSTARFEGKSGARKSLGGRASILPILTSFRVFAVLRYSSFFDNPTEPFKGDNWNSIFDKYGGKVVKIFEKSVFLVVKFGNFG